MMSDIAAISPGPYRWGIFPEGEDQVEWIRKMLSFGSGDIHCVYLPGHKNSRIGSDEYKPEHAVTLCITGNGPNSKANALALCELLSRRESAKNRTGLPIPTTPECVAWSQYAIELEEALGIAAEVPEHLKNLTFAEIVERKEQPDQPEPRDPPGWEGGFAENH